MPSSFILKQILFCSFSEREEVGGREGERDEGLGKEIGWSGDVRRKACGCEDVLCPCVDRSSERYI